MVRRGYVVGAAWLCAWCGVAMWLVRRGYVAGAAWLCGRCGVAMWLVRRGYVVSASGCCTAVPGSNPARHPSLGSAQENPGAIKIGADFSSAAAGDTSAAAGVSARHQG